MNQDSFIPLSAVSQKWLEEKFRNLEEKISSIEPARKSIKDEWLTLQEFMEATGVKSHYSISKMVSISEERGEKFRSKFLGKRRYIHRSEVEKYFSGEFEK
ncbi:hypothetical protein [Anditalea andensis]|uniref:Helix-turn-helix domain-containing protein n=1 Tax=Anditalea andensis TaxID=1048983 RepID=A0A074KXI8_9BACT|nr:hypothetical protein [Anditalea andensis]KEO72935.1 hypothetical protein EL17_15040 [Anditalea andensis]